MYSFLGGATIIDLLHSDHRQPPEEGDYDPPPRNKIQEPPTSSRD